MSRSYFRVNRYSLTRAGSDTESPTPWAYLISEGSYRALDTVSRDRAEAFIPDALTFGDYSGYGSAGKANIRFLSEEFAALEDIAWTRVYACHGHNAIAIHPYYAERDSDHTDDEAAFVEFLDGLEYYPVACESTLSEVEMEEESEAWESYGYFDLARSVRNAFDFAEEFNEDHAKALWCNLESYDCDYTTHEQGGCYLDTDKIVKRLVDETAVRAAMATAAAAE